MHFSTLLNGATVIDGTGGEPLERAAVGITDGRIAAVGPESEFVGATADEVLNVSGSYVIPGLMDANVHLFLDFAPETLIRLDGRYDEVVEEAAQIALRGGVTTVFDTCGPLDALITVRDRINAGKVVGSRVFVAGNIIGLGGPLSEDFIDVSTALSPITTDHINAQWEKDVGADLVWLTPEEVRARTRDYIECSGIDFVKYAGSGHHNMQFILFSAPAQRAIVEEAHRAGLTAQAHTTSVETLRMEIEAGADILQHPDVTMFGPIPPSTLELIVERRLPCAALLATERNVEWNSRNAGETMRTLVLNKDLNARSLIDTGAVLLLTTDAGVFSREAFEHPQLGPSLKDVDDRTTELGESHFLWLRAAIERGMAPMEALLSATSHIANAYGQGHDVGTLQVGKRADLLVLQADPLADPDNYRTIALIMKDGAFVDTSTFPQRPILTTAAR